MQPSVIKVHFSPQFSLHNNSTIQNCTCWQPVLHTDLHPVIQPLHHIPLVLCNDVTAELTKLLEACIIEPVDASTWITNLVNAKNFFFASVCGLKGSKQGRGPRYSKYPPCTTEELTSQCYGCKIFSKLDLRQGHLQVPLHPESCNLTAFVSYAGVIRYIRVPFGLCSAPSCFQKKCLYLLASPGLLFF